MFKHAPQFGVVVDVPGVQIVANGSFKKCGILWYDGEASAQIQQANSRGIKAIDTTGYGLA